jgi:hypothetical protein
VAFFLRSSRTFLTAKLLALEGNVICDLILFHTFLVLLVNVAYASAKTTMMTDLGPLGATALNVAEHRLLTLGIAAALAVKTPVATIRHTHAEGNDAANSVIVAGLILSVAVAGIVRRVLIPLLAEATVTADLALVAQTLTLVTVLFVALMTLEQTEFEALVLTKALSATRALGSREGPLSLARWSRALVSTTRFRTSIDFPSLSLSFSFSFFEPLCCVSDV